MTEVEDEEEYPEPCFTCNGAGGYEDWDGEWVSCSSCSGSGMDA